MMIQSTRLLLGLIVAVTIGVTSMNAAQREGCHIEEIIDVDGDQQLLLESEWISMHIMPEHQSMIVRFVFRPSGNNILEVVQPKNAMSGYGLLQDNFWGQDWRYSEFRGRYYDYEIVKNTPEEVAVAFETKSEGWLQGANSGIISKLWSNIRIRRTVRLRSGAPYFLFDLELINEDTNAKLPPMWVHNASLCDPVQGDFVYRPSVLGSREIGKIGEIYYAKGDHYIRDFNQGWSARIAPVRKEGLVYLMDYDYLNFMYNNGTGSSEWVCDNVLISKERPWSGRTYILPVLGLSRADYACEHFIIAVHPKREKDNLNIEYKVTASYEQVKRITFNTDLSYGHYRGEGHVDDPKTIKLEPVEVEGLGVAPVTANVVIDQPPEDPLLLTIKAHLEMPDGTIKTQRFQVFHVGEYEFKRNVRMDMSTPVVKLEREPLKPFIPTPKANAKVNRKDWKIFGVLGNHCSRMGLRKHIRTVGDLNEEENIGYTPGFDQPDNGLTDFPFDYERLFDHRVLVWANAQLDVARAVGASMAANYLEAGGNLVITGGDNAFRQVFTSPPNPLDAYIPVQAKPNNLYKGVQQLNSPVADHPIFKGIKLDTLPHAFFTHHVAVKPDMDAKVLLKVGEHPFIVESNKGDQRTMVVLCAPFGDEKEFPGKQPFWKWSEWPKLFANVVRYAGHDQ